MDLLGTAWKLLMLRGVIGVLFGIVAIAWPISTVVALAVLWAIWALVDGLGLATEALREGTTGERLLAGVVAVVAVLAGLYAIFHPGATAVLLTWIVGIWLLVRGLFEVWAPSGIGCRARPGRRWWSAHWSTSSSAASSSRTPARARSGSPRCSAWSRSCGASSWS
jgi:hypothetical protein